MFPSFRPNSFILFLFLSFPFIFLLPFTTTSHGVAEDHAKTLSHTPKICGNNQRHDDASDLNEFFPEARIPSDSNVGQLSDPSAVSHIANPLLQRAHTALRAWKSAIVSDPHNFTGNWVGDDVCTYNGIVCTPSLDDPTRHAVAGIDLNRADLEGHLPMELSLFHEVSLIHLNSNKFRGQIPQKLSKLVHLQELDLSNNGFHGPFPEEVLRLPNLKYLDLRYNNFEGVLPPELFDKDLDALLINNNRFNGTLPINIGNSKLSAMVLANNNFEGGIPKSIGNMNQTLNEIVIGNNSFSGCLPLELGSLINVAVLDLSLNSFTGVLPEKMIEGLQNVEQLNVANNKLTGTLPHGICQLKKLDNFTYSSNYFNGNRLECQRPGKVEFDRGLNCIDGEEEGEEEEERRKEEFAVAAFEHSASCSEQKNEIPSGRSSYSPAPSSLSPSSHRIVLEQQPAASLPPVGGFGYASPPPPMMKDN
ncbi:leucine-rich repeat extensin-like protein 7 [Zingiber officinale]|uniref:leucine-rich repeat extensin-like protein 7 n=1 Tax=Zingiber officinale TaxID=94328 RepID=UPI001C4C99DE|nr:leucine-rich repeat extensin-like protein 7 [Zingiber officinale]